MNRERMCRASVELSKLNNCEEKVGKGRKQKRKEVRIGEFVKSSCLDLKQ